MNEYYPQNDWENYLHLVDNPNDPNLSQKDKDFIQKIIDRYGLDISVKGSK